ncbi:alpha-hydroxy acid oxidase [Acidisphaera sp. L21]|jgi:isopentenyl diphosphate isomerase/L-lactate dehydrogenase-like FMN-dependent dehydrogenase|uniref:alpha-hydroxy acid oxidase n=1 Tax=Acidisphaera sp. L21 TaxID=1641851 RepID=UPI00131D0D82|nr:alpha-hydroxy acid oxidase [Acidisphaera sp. L21]
MPETSENDFQTLHEIVRAAHGVLDRNLWDYVTGATETETTQRRNRLALDRLGFRPRVLRDVSRIDPSADFLGYRIPSPVLLAPVGGLESLRMSGGVAVAEGAGQAGFPFFLSSVTQSGLEAVAAAATGPKVFQLYVRGDESWVDDHARRAIESGYDAFCLTVDSAIYSRRERDIANRFSKPWRGNTPGMEYQAALNWDQVHRFRSKHAIPLILKGIATAEDADLACQAGVDMVYVSNHGGRQLDHGVGSLDVLPEIVQAVAGRARIVVDGGISRGSDVVKAIIAGADYVGIGRLYCYGLAAAGAAGVVRVLELLQEEIVECLGLLGVTSMAELDASFLRPAEPVVVPHALSAFPLLDLPPQRYER